MTPGPTTTTERQPRIIPANDAMRELIRLTAQESKATAKLDEIRRKIADAKAEARKALDDE